MKVRYDEGIATRIGPEPCATVCEDGDEASAGECIGQPLSREIGLFSGCRRCSASGRQHGRARYCECPLGSARSETLACADAPCTGTGRSHA